MARSLAKTSWDENRPRKVAGYQDDPAVDAIREDSGQRARYGGQQTGDERAARPRRCP